TPAATTAPPPAASAVRSMQDPRELLARWAREDALGSLDLGAPMPRVAAPETRTQLRFDGAHAPSAPQAPTVERVAAEIPPRIVPPPKPAPSEPPVKEIAIHAAHGTGGPHYAAAPLLLADKSTRWVTLAGQLFAYFGVGGLT